MQVIRITSFKNQPRREDFQKLQEALPQLERLLKDELHRNRLDQQQLSSETRRELSENLSTTRREINERLTGFEQQLSRSIEMLTKEVNERFTAFGLLQQQFNQQYVENMKDVRLSIEKQLTAIKEDNTLQLTEMRKTVDEKLQKTINDRLSQSFETVGKQLQAVQEGLGEMRNLATDVGGLKRVLSNVKLRGGIGEVQLSLLLEQLLAPDQYAANVITKPGSNDTVEFAIKLPGKDTYQDHVWLPIDAKFPKDIYEQLQDAYDKADPSAMQLAHKNLDATIKKMARDIRQKYVSPPATTDFAILFLPFEGIYAEVVRKASLLETLQRDYKIIVTGPSTLAAILNSLQMGFKTLAIQKRSSEVWQILGAVKTEFDNFAGIMQKAQKNIQTGLNQLDDVMGKRTRAIQRKLKDVEALEASAVKTILPHIIEEDDLQDNG